MKDSLEDVLQFWFEEISPAQWFQRNPDFDSFLKERFLSSYEKARDGIFSDRKNESDGCLALCLLLGEFTRRMFRGNARAYATDREALVIAKYAVSKGFDQLLPIPKRRFLYLPFARSEVLGDQNRSVLLFEKIRKGDPLSYEMALRRQKIIEDYNRFPSRNTLLGRTNTPEEDFYLSQTTHSQEGLH